MAPPTQAPELTPQFCFNQRALRDFLRLSRSSIDDSINQSLNALLTPSTTTPFDPTSTVFRPLTSSITQRRSIPPQSCHAFIRGQLYPNWALRSDILDYCARLANMPPPHIPGGGAGTAGVPGAVDEASPTAARAAPAVDRRTDPYSGREPSTRSEVEDLAGLILNERGVERIVRGRTWAVVRDRCGEGCGAEEWTEDFDRWRAAAAGLQR